MTQSKTEQIKNKRARALLELERFQGQTICDIPGCGFPLTERVRKTNKTIIGKQKQNCCEMQPMQIFLRRMSCNALSCATTNGAVDDLPRHRCEIFVYKHGNSRADTWFV